jgi:L-lactate dehydrogenase complex protein LldE
MENPVEPEGIPGYIPGMRVHLFIPCLIDQFRPEAGEAALSVLESLDLQVDYTPEQICCGQPFFTAGRLDASRRLARKTLSNFRDGQIVVAPSGSCVRMIRHHYQELFQGDPVWEKRAQELAGRVYELSEFLVRVLGCEDLGASFPEKVTFHDSCQVRRGLGIFKEPRALLGRVKGLELVEMNRPGECCGFGGVFSAKFPHIAEAIVMDKIQDAVSTGAGIVSGCEISCLLHIERHARATGAPIRTLHLAEILASGLGS